MRYEDQLRSLNEMSENERNSTNLSTRKVVLSTNALVNLSAIARPCTMPSERVVSVCGGVDGMETHDYASAYHEGIYCQSRFQVLISLPQQP